MGKVILTIDGPIGQWGYSQQWLNQMLDGKKTDEITLNISSLGGSLNHALAMHDALAAHGNVNAFISGFTASSGTILASAAKTRKISTNSMFLVHKALSWIDEFGMLNEDDIDDLIQRLEKQKNENAKMTLVIAKIYSKRSGKKNIQEILNLMKDDTWITADEAVEWGFADETFEPGPDTYNVLFDENSIAAMITAAGLPKVSQPRLPANAPPAIPETAFSKSVLINTLKEFFTPKLKAMKIETPLLNQALGIESLEATSEGVFLNQEQLVAVEKAIANRTQQETDNISNLTAQTETLQADVTRIQNELQQAQTDTQAQTDHYNELLNLVNGIGDSVANATSHTDKTNAIRSLLLKKPAVAPIGNVTTTDPNASNAGVDWDFINKLPHNQEADSL